MKIELPYSTIEIEKILTSLGWERLGYWRKGAYKCSGMIDAWNWQFNYD
jgi:hypothetical protein